MNENPLSLFGIFYRHWYSTGGRYCHCVLRKWFWVIAEWCFVWVFLLPVGDIVIMLTELWWWPGVGFQILYLWGEWRKLIYFYPALTLRVLLRCLSGTRLKGTPVCRGYRDGIYRGWLLCELEGRENEVPYVYLPAESRSGTPKMYTRCNLTSINQVVVYL